MFKTQCPGIQRHNLPDDSSPLSRMAELWSWSYCTGSLDIEYGWCEVLVSWTGLIPNLGQDLWVCFHGYMNTLKKLEEQASPCSTVVWPRSIVAEVFVCVHWRTCLWYVCAYMCVQRGCLCLSVSGQVGLFPSHHDWLRGRTLAGEFAKTNERG